MILFYNHFLCLGKFDPAAGLAQSGIAGTGPPEPPDDATAPSTTGNVPTTVATSPHSATPASIESKKEEQEKPKEAEVDQNQLEIPKKEEELKETEEDTKSTMDAETMEAKEKKDKVNSSFILLLCYKSL